MPYYYAEVVIDEQIYCNKVKNSKDFKIFTIEVSGRKKITGFKFKFKFDKEIDYNKNFDYMLLNRYVLHYFDFLSSLTLYTLTKNYYEIKIFDINDNFLVELRIQTPIPMKSEVDIDVNLYQNILSDLTDKSRENFRYYYAGVLFYNSRLYEFSIREFFKIIEGDESIKDYEHFNIIRDLFSHNYDVLDRASKKFKDKIDLKNKFISKEFTGKDNKPIIIIDRYNPNNMQSLIIMAKQLKEIVEAQILHSYHYVTIFKLLNNFCLLK
jgi:hypothetical protein